MFYTYQIQDNIFSNMLTNGDLVVNVEKAISLFERLEKNSKFVDCYDECKISLLGKDFNEAYNSLLDSDVDEKKLLELLFIDTLKKNM